jgi:enterochelin esterase family protein
MNIDENLVESASGQFSRKVWLLKIGERPQKLCVFLDAEYYLDKIDAPGILERLQGDGVIPSVAAVFVSNLDNAARHHDYACNLDYSRFVAEDVVGWARANVEGLGELEHSVVGLSLSGLASAFLTLSYPEVFPACIAQSGSFWWNEELFAKNVGSFPQVVRRIWLSVGDKETEKGVSHEPSGMRQEETQLAAVRAAAEALQTTGAVVRYRVFAGGHAIEPWANELPSALRWVIGR